MSTISLRHLARQYADGALDQVSYRRARADYLESVLNGNDPPGSVTQANYTSPKAVAGEETITEATFRRGTEETQILWRAGDKNQSGEQEPYLQTQPIQLNDRSLPNVYITAGVAAGAIVLLVGASLLFMGDDEPATSSAPAATATEQTAEDQALQAIASNNGNSALRQLKQFLDAPQWSQQALDDFASRWQQLPREQREAALDTTLARQLSDELFRQLQEERALQGLDGNNGNTLAGQQKIVDFARAIGLDDPRLEVTEAE